MASTPTTIDAVELSDDELADELVRLGREGDQIALRFADRAAQFAARKKYDVDGFLSPIDWMRFNCHMTSGAAANSIAVGQAMDRMPESMQAMSVGEIGFAHLTVMARTADALKERFDEALLVEKAKDNSPGKFHYVCQHYRHAADQKRYAAEQAEQVLNRRLTLSTWLDGSVILSGVFDPEGGAALRTALEPLARKSGAHDDRDRDRRMADALVDLAIHALDAGLIPQQASQRTHLMVTASLETLRGLPGASAADMEFSVPVSAQTVERLACDASITRIVLGSDSMVIDVGRAKRVISGPTRKALNFRDSHCTWPGCERPASWTSGHHLVHWIHGGTSDLENLALLCYRHHWNVHEGNWQLV
ncbi:MAG: HNH endonuclease, partial [Candidatus Dormibacteraeota bacterium]|nr:HNH endonuclease [Candidatus Dormibacteraeota bacterium]